MKINSNPSCISTSQSTGFLGLPKSKHFLMILSVITICFISTGCFKFPTFTNKKPAAPTRYPEKTKDVSIEKKYTKITKGTTKIKEYKKNIKSKEEKSITNESKGTTFVGAIKKYAIILIIILIVIGIFSPATAVWIVKRIHRLGNKALTQTVRGIDEYMKKAPPEQVEELEKHLRGTMDQNVKDFIKKKGRK